MVVLLPMVGDPAQQAPQDAQIHAPVFSPAPMRRAVAAAPAAPQALPSPTPPATAAPPSRKRILVVDDEPGLCALACDWITALGHEVVGVNSPQEALARLGEQSFDLLFTDVVMPGDMDGLALAIEVKSRQPGLRVLLASGYARVLLENRNLPGALLGKPYRKKEVAQALETALRD